MILRAGLLIIAAVRPLCPQIYHAAHHSPKLSNLLDKNFLFIAPKTNFVSRKMSTDAVKYDFAVIGGGPGGMAAAKEAARLGAKVIIFDHVKPSHRGTSWGFGGVCVNVGCVPKKLMHYASLLGVARQDIKKLGYQINDVDSTINWTTIKDLVSNYIKMLNFSYRSSLIVKGVKYVNRRVSLKSANEITYTDTDGREIVVCAKYILLAIGDRPHTPPEIDKSLVITSDDLFYLNNDPGKTLVVGASYVALECAGFLTGMGYHVTVAVRSIVLRGFDRQCSEKVANLMENTGTHFKYGILPINIVKECDGKLKVVFSDNSIDTFDTVLYATGRSPDLADMNLQNVGIQLSPNGRIIAENDQTSVPNVFAVGDIVENRPQLAPVAIKAGEMLSRRLFGNSKQMMDYSNIPTTIFTPYEFSTCGLSEEQAIDKYGENNLTIYLSEFTSLEQSLAHRMKTRHLITDEFDTDLPPTCLSKLIVEKGTDLVVGIHFVGPNAGEVMQGMALAMKLGVKKSDFDLTLGIHPTDAESFMNLNVTKDSGESWVSSGGCGGGKCG
ncbi:thioredoxin reductase (NADPH) [Babesia microti strain RI]|uniref:Thioredoxin reductase n=2 Tax=Babesia microti TaxID=5868 RepID=A0A1R4AAX8_BABMR|nr:thioredoxin reductase (NADPH) [Babesia microti strain RI]AON76718.1 thioredoxin reductase [Babesia microti]SJK86114.1 thioredoxin reductase (NADPH) [Babesia microti strain RI]|eukprot:XP_021338310.1 thioredoxin reductase (NADPH) [Babesia microti strain RI]